MLRKITIFLLILSASLTKQGWSEEKLPYEVKLSIFPKEVAPGDTSYVRVEVTNNSDFLVRVLEPEFYRAIKSQLVQFSLSREGKTWQGTFEPEATLGTFHPPWIDYNVASGETIVLLALSLQFPPLDELHIPFWEATLKELQNHPEGILFDFWIKFPGAFLDYPLLLDEDFRKKVYKIIDRIDPDRTKLGPQTDQVTIKLRNAEEMAMIEKWYQNTPRRYFPVIEEHGRDLNSPLYLKRPSKPMILGIRHEPSSRKILGYNPWYFMTIGNRYPADPNAPETWQGWKELEDSVTPSTMRDEIRLTRILIQYCDTKDENVMEELKGWFAGMNKVQRVCMAKSVWDRIKGTSGNHVLYEPCCDLYKMIREYDIAVKIETEIEWMKKLKLIE